MRALLLAVCLSAGEVPAPDVFPWTGSLHLKDARGAALTWTVKRQEGEVLVTVEHPLWVTTHRARPDGTPLFTLHKRNGFTRRVRYAPDGLTVENTDELGRRSSCSAREKDLVDGFSLAARLAGRRWRPGAPWRFKLVDIDDAACPVYPMVVEYVAEEACGAGRCHHLRLALDDWRRLFAPQYEYRFSTAPGARFLRYVGDGYDFNAGS